MLSARHLDKIYRCLALFLLQFYQFACFYIENAFTYVGDMISNAFQVTRNQKQLDGLIDGAGIFLHKVA